MEIYEVINQKIKEKGMNKKEFVHKVLALEPKLKNTGETPTDKTIYAYLNGTANLKLELIPYIAEALDTIEQEIFNDSEHSRIKYIKRILKNPSKKELETIKYYLGNGDMNIKNSIVPDINHGSIIINSEYMTEDTKLLIGLLKYASNSFIKKLILKLQQLKELEDNF